MYSADPFEDLSRWEQEELENEKLFPVCANCGERILSETYYAVGNTYYCHNCIEEKATEDYVERGKEWEN